MALIHRSVIRTISGLLPDHAIVLVEGPPRCGKSTMARQLAASSPSGSVLVDARLREGRAILSAPGSQSAARPIILDNAQPVDAKKLMAWVQSTAGQGSGNGCDESSNLRLPRFVLVGGPFGGLEQRGDSPGDRPRLGDRPGHHVAGIRMGPLSLFEAGRAALRRLWLRGGYPEAFGADSNDAAFDWLELYAAELARGALAAWGRTREPGLITGLLETVAANNGQAFNENAAARMLGVSRPTISRYLSILHRTGILFSLPALPSGLIKTSVRAPALYVHDSGLLHCLLGVRSPDNLALKPGSAGASWAGFVVEQALEAAPSGTGLFRYASADGATLDLVVVRDGSPVLVAAARRHRPASVERSIAYAARALDGARPGRFIVVPDGVERELPGGFTIIGLGSFLELLAVA